MKIKSFYLKNVCLVKRNDSLHNCQGDKVRNVRVRNVFELIIL